MNDSVVVNLFNEIRKHQIDAPYVENNYKFWQVETLLNQAADLLDRCVVDLNAVKSLEAQAKFLELEINKERKLLGLRKEKIKSGILDDKIDRLNKNKRDLDLIKPDLDSAMSHATGAYHSSGNDALLNNQTGRDVNLTQISVKKHDQSYKSAEQELKWSIRDRIFALKEHDILQEAFDNKIKETVDGQILDFKLQANIAAERCLRDYKDASDRMWSAEQGLKIIFNYQGPALPKGKSVHECVTWVRNAIQWMIRFSHNNQYFTVNISLKGILGQEEFESKITSNSTLRFKISEEYFKNHKFVRLRGMAGFVMTQNKVKTPWQYIVAIPKNALIKFKSTTNDIDQSALPYVTLGRVEDRLSNRPPEVVGSNSHINTSPIGDSSDGGEWSIKVEPALLDSDNLNDILDIQLELYLIGQSS